MGSFSAVSIDTRYKAEGPFTLSGIAAKSGWHRAYVERVIGTVRRECLAHMIVFSERSLGIPGVLSSESHAFGAGERQSRVTAGAIAGVGTDRADSGDGRPPSSL